MCDKELQSISKKNLLHDRYEAVGQTHISLSNLYVYKQSDVV